MNWSLIVKFVVAGALAIALIVPLGAILGVVHERESASRSVLEDVQRTGVGEQTITGPILVVPYRRTIRSETTDPETGRKSVVTSHDEGEQYFLPDSLSEKVNVETEKRLRGIYSVLLFDAQHAITGSFVVPERFGVPESSDIDYAFTESYLILGIGDTRGIRGAPTVEWNGKKAEWKGGTRGSRLRGGVNALVGAVEPERTYSFAIELLLQGSQTIDYVPAGKQTTIEMRSAWPHPSFNGQFLPESRAVTAQGFEATWRTSHLSSNVDTTLRELLSGNRDARPIALGVSFIEPVNVYLQSERATKYGFLFVGLTFLVFLLFELLKDLAIHPVQYGLVGMGLVIFFLLLLALTEHVSFALAYLIASTACVGLLAFYVSFVLRSALRAAGFTGLLSALYGALFVLLRSEDMALLLGAVLLFGILAAIMVITRRVDWYRLGAARPDPAPGIHSAAVQPPA